MARGLLNLKITYTYSLLIHCLQIPRRNQIIQKRSFCRCKIARRGKTADRHMGVSECQWHSSCEPTEPTGEKTAFGLSEAVP